MPQAFRLVEEPAGAWPRRYVEEIRRRALWNPGDASAPVDLTVAFHLAAANAGSTRRRAAARAFEEITMRSKASAVRVTRAGTVKTQPAYNRGELRRVIAGGVPARAAPAVQAIAACCSSPTARQVRRLAELHATHEDVTVRAAAFRRRWPGRRLTAGRLLSSWGDLEP